MSVEYIAHFTQVYLYNDNDVFYLNKVVINNLS